MMRLRTIIFGMLLGFASCIMASQTRQPGTITGRVLDETTDQGLEGVNIVVMGTVMGTASGPDGAFRIRGISPGNYTIQFTMIGYKATIDTVPVHAGEITRLAIALEPTVLESPQLVVTGEKRSVRVENSPVSIGTIRDSEIRLRMPTTINEILPYHSGVQMIGGQINIRGSSGYTRGAGSRVLVLVDGFPVLASDNDGIYWNAIPMQNIRRVEILKGAGSALYGSNALGGVVNVITTPISEQPHTTIRGQGGYYSVPSNPSWRWREQPLITGMWSVSHERQLDSLGVRAGLSYRSSPGYSQNGWYRRWNVTGKFHLTPSENTEWNGRLYLVRDIHGVVTQWRNAHRPFNVPLESVGDYLTNHHLQVALSYSDVVSSRMAHTWRTIYYRKAFQNYQHDNNDYSVSHTFSTEWQTDYQATSSHLVTAGIEVTGDRIIADLWGNHTSYDVAGYLQDEWSISALTRLVAGLRADLLQIDARPVLMQVNPKIGLNHNLTDSWTVRASVGRGFRSPSISERFTRTRQYIFQVAPNPDLQPEVSWSGEIGTHYESSALTLDLALFSSRYRNFIDPLQDPATGTISFQNITNANIRGTEIALEWKVPYLPVRQVIGYTYLHPRDLTQDTVLAYRHEHSVVSTTNILVSRKLLCSVEYQYRSKIRRVQVYPTNPATGSDKRVPVHLWSLHGSYQISNHLTLRFSAENLFQYYYVMIERNMGAPRHLQLGLDYLY